MMHMNEERRATSWQEEKFAKTLKQELEGLTEGDNEYED